MHDLQSTGAMIREACEDLRFVIDEYQPKTLKPYKHVVRWLHDILGRIEANASHLNEPDSVAWLWETCNVLKYFAVLLGNDGDAVGGDLQVGIAVCGEDIWDIMKGACSVERENKGGNRG